MSKPRGPRSPMVCRKVVPAVLMRQTAQQEVLQMKKSVLTNARLTSYERGNCSVYGNPSWYVCFDNGSEEITGKTASDASCGYVVENFRDGRACNVTYHVTRAGNVIIDKIEEA